MSRGVNFLLLLLGTFYLAMIYNSRSLVFLGYAEIFIALLLFLYNLFVFSKIRITLEAPLGVTELWKKVPIKITIQNDSMFPSGKIWIQLVESYSLEKRKKKTIFGSSVDGRKRSAGQQSAVTVIDAVWQPRTLGKTKISLKKARCFDLLGLFALPLPKKAYRMTEEIIVLPEYIPVPVEIGKASRDFAVEREYYTKEGNRGQEAEQFQIREYRQGDRLRNIHWKLSAKENQWMVKEYHSELGCPVLLFLDWKSPVRETVFRHRRTAKEKEAFFTILLSLSCSMAENGCSHFVIWYDGRQKDVVRYCVRTQEDVYQLLLQMDGLEAAEEMFDMEEEYYHKYHERGCVTRLTLNRSLQLICNEQQTVQYNWQDLENTLTAVTIDL